MGGRPDHAVSGKNCPKGKFSPSAEKGRGFSFSSLKAQYGFPKFDLFHNTPKSDAGEGVGYEAVVLGRQVQNQTCPRPKYRRPVKFKLQINNNHFLGGVLVQVSPTPTVTGTYLDQSYSLFI